MKSKLKSMLVAALLGTTFSIGAHATTISLTSADFNVWQAFDVDDSVSPIANPLGWIDASYNGDFSTLSFSLTLAAPAYLRIVDSGFAGDRFSISDNGNLLGLTSLPGNTYPSLALGPTQADFYQAYADGRFSHGEFLLGAGTHEITGVLVSSATPDFNASVGGLMITPVPEPETFALMLAGLALVGAMARRRT